MLEYNKPILRLLIEGTSPNIIFENSQMYIVKRWLNCTLWDAQKILFRLACIFLPLNTNIYIVAGCLNEDNSITLQDLDGNIAIFTLDNDKTSDGNYYFTVKNDFHIGNYKMSKKNSEIGIYRIL